MEKQQKKQVKRYISWGLIVVLVAVLTAMPLLAGTEEESDGPVASVLSSRVERADIDTQVIGGGTLTGESAVEVEIPAAVKLTEYLVANGDIVAEGDPVATVDRVTVMTAITQVQETLEYLAEEIQSVSDDVTSEKVTAQAGGTVKILYAQSGDNVRDVMLRDGALAVLSLDGLMAVQVERSTNLSGGDTVCVVFDDDTEVEGRVESNLEGILTVTIEDENYAVGEKVTVMSEDGNRIGTGRLYIHSQWNATAYSGTVSKVRVKEGDTVKAGKTLIELQDTGHTAEYYALSDQHREYEALMLDLFVMYQSETITAPASGMISGVDENGTYMLSGTGEDWQVTLLANAPNGDDETSYVNCVGQIYEVGLDGLIVKLNPAQLSITDYKDLSGVPLDTSLMTAEVIYSAQAPVYELSGGEWVQISSGALTAGDILLFAGDSSGNIIWVVRVAHTAVNPGETETSEPTTPNQPEEPTETGDSTEPTNPNQTTQGAGSGQSGGRSPQTGSFGGMGSASEEDEYELYGLEMVSICSVTAQEEMTVEITVDELDITKLYVGQPAQITVNALVGQTFDAVVTQIGNSGTNEGGNSKFTVELTMDKVEDMLPGMNVSAFITLKTAENVPCVKVDALVEQGSTVILYTGYDEESKTFTDPVTVTLGVSDGENVQVLSGIEEGTTYFYSYYDTLVISDAPEMSGSLFGR